MTDQDDTADWESYEKQQAANHEAGHATVAAITTTCICCWLEGNEDGTEDEKLWLGKMTGVISPAVAGIAVEYYAEEVFSDNNARNLAREIVWHIDEAPEGEVSDTDLQFLPDDESERVDATTEAVTILRENRDLYDWLVAELIAGHVVTGGMISDRLRACR